MRSATAGGDGAAGPLTKVDLPGEQLKLFSFLEEMAGPCRQVLRAAWAARGKLVQDVRSYIFLFGSVICSMPGRAMRVVNNPKLHTLIAEEEDPEALAAVVFGTGGALCLGSVGGVVGAACGGAFGTTMGAIPALFTFGLSLPVGALIGITFGVASGAMVGGTAGFTAGAASGTTVAYFRKDIRRTVLYTASILHDTYNFLVARPVAAVKHSTRRARETAICSVDFTKAKAARGVELVQSTASDRRVQVSVASAGAGAAALGTAGAVGGSLAGGTVGALVGVVPAVFTFGLSIPVGAMVGGGAGLVAGGAAGTTAGFVCGGGLGFLGFSYREAPGSALVYVQDRCCAAAAAVGLVSSPLATNTQTAAGAPMEHKKVD